MTDIRLTLAIDDYDHIRDLTSGLIKPQGIDLTWLRLPVEETFYRFASGYEWEISELSLAKYCALRSQENPPVVGIPVFVSRMFRHSAFYIRTGSAITSVEDLRGGRIGIPEWSQTATVYARGWLQHDAGIDLTDIEWIQGGVNQPGREERADLSLPTGIRYRQVADRSLSDMLIAGDLDAVISARPPTSFTIGDGRICRLMPDYRTAERDYFGRTGIYPIMHTIAIRRDVYQKYPWIAMNLLTAFEQAKRNSIERLSDITASRIPLAWLPDLFAKLHAEIFPEGDYWPYGIEHNRKTLQAFVDFCQEQGVTQRPLALEELFVKEVYSAYRV